MNPLKKHRRETRKLRVSGRALKNFVWIGIQEGILREATLGDR